MVNKLLGIAKTLPKEEKEKMIKAFTEKNKGREEFELALAQLKKTIEYEG